MKKIIDELNYQLNFNAISYDVYSTSMYVLFKLPNNILNSIKLDNVYSSSCGALIVDWCGKDNNKFSLEIGNKIFRYFSEHNGEIIQLVEHCDTRKSNIYKLIDDINEFLLLHSN